MSGEKISQLTATREGLKAPGGVLRFIGGIALGATVAGGIGYGAANVLMAKHDARGLAEEGISYKEVERRYKEELSYPIGLKEIGSPEEIPKQSDAGRIVHIDKVIVDQSIGRDHLQDSDRVKSLGSPETTKNHA